MIAELLAALLATAPAPGLQLGRTAQILVEVDGTASGELGAALGAV